MTESMGRYKNMYSTPENRANRQYRKREKRWTWNLHKASTPKQLRDSLDKVFLKGNLTKT